MRLTHHRSWKWKMKIQLTCFNNRLEASFNQPQMLHHCSSLTQSTSPACDRQRPLQQISMQKKFSFSLHYTQLLYSVCRSYPCYFSVFVHEPRPGFVCSCCIVVRGLQTGRTGDGGRMNATDFTELMLLGSAW